MLDRILNLFARIIDWFARLAALAMQPFQRYVEPVRRATAPATEAARAWYEKREPREKILIRAAGGILALLLLYDLIYAPFIGIRQTLADRVTSRQSDLIAVRNMMQTYVRLKYELAAAQRRTVPDNPNFSLFSIIEQTLTKSVGRERIGSISPNDHEVTGGFHQFSVDIKLNDVTLAQVVDTLYGVETLGIPVTVSNLQLHEHTGDSHTFDVDMSCMALAKNG